MTELPRAPKLVRADIVAPTPPTAASSSPVEYDDYDDDDDDYDDDGDENENNERKRRRRRLVDEEEEEEGYVYGYRLKMCDVHVGSVVVYHVDYDEDCDIPCRHQTPTPRDARHDDDMGDDDEGGTTRPLHLGPGCELLAIGDKKVSSLLLGAGGGGGGGVSVIAKAIREGVERDGRVRGER